MKGVVRTRIAAIGAAAAVAIVTVGSSYAIAATPVSVAGSSVSDLPIAKANPGVSEKVIASLPEVVQQSTVKIDGSYTAGTPIVYPDGKPVPGQTPAAARAAALASAFCSGTAYGNGFGGWGQPSYCNVGVFGSPGWRQGYTWSSSPGIDQPSGCAQGKGFDSSGTATWYVLGLCGQGYSFTVPWGNVLAIPGVRVKSLSVPSGITVNWESS